MPRKRKIFTEQCLVFSTGERFPIIGENGKYWFCEGTQFRKSNPAIERVEPMRMQEEPIAEEVMENNNREEK